MKSLSNFLNKFRNLVKDDGKLKEKTSETIEEITGIVIEKDSISFNSRGSLFIACPPIVRSEIFMKRDLIIEALNKKSEKKILDILFRF